jgi:uncharacterized protein
LKVISLALTPVKGTRLRQVESLELTARGARGNREFFVIDERNRMVNGKQVGELNQVVSELVDGELRLTLGADTLSAPVRLGPPIRARFYSRTVEGRQLEGPLSDALSEFVGREVRLLAAAGAVDRGARGAVTLISRASLEQLASAAGIDSVDARRFRMLVEIDGVGPHEEDQWVGRTARLGEDAVVRFGGHVGRCLVTSRDPETGEIDLPTLDILRDYRGDLDTTEPLAFGIHGSVRKPGTIRAGDRVSIA